MKGVLAVAEKNELDFYKTDLGKFMKLVEIIGCILVVIGLGLAVFEAVVHAKNLEEQYQSIIDFGNSAIIYGLICLLANGTIRNDYYVKKQK